MYCQPPVSSVYLSKPAKTVAALALVLLLITGYVLSTDKAFDAWLADNLAWINTHRIQTRIIFILLLATVSSTGIFPASLLVVAAGSVFGLAYGLALSIAGIFMGSIGGLLVGRHIFRDAISSHISSHISIDALDEEIRRRGWKFIILLRLSPFIPFVIGSYALGISAIRLRDYCIGTIGVLPTLFALTYTGSLAGGITNLNIDTGQQTWNTVQTGALLTGLAASIAVVVVLSRIAARVTQSVRNKSDKSG